MASEKKNVRKTLLLLLDQISDDRYEQRINYETTQQELTKANGKLKDLENETNEIDALKKAIADKDYIIDDLVLERDQISDDRYEQRIKYETTQKQLLQANGKIKDLENERACIKKEVDDLNYNITNSLRGEILRLRRREGKKPPEEATGKLGDLEKKYDTTESLDVDQVDSGISIDMESLNHVIERKIDTLIDEKLKHKQFPSSCEELVPQKASTNEIKKYPTIREADTRERNIIIHGLKEDEISDHYQIKEIFAATTTQCAPLSVCRLGVEKADKDRPILLRMQSTREKEEFMSKLWMLKNVKMKFNKLSITNDYTLDERKMIKKCVEEANKRNMTGTIGYTWKVRGTPKEGMRIIKIAKQE